jgi:pimeloyl-ACP methyl ester carboxylesterase/DNA-binding CsgD family transcriptional regulator
MDTVSDPRVPSVSGIDLEILVRDVAAGVVDFGELVQALMPMIRGDEQLPPEVALQLSTALIEIERDAAREDPLYALVNEQGAAAVALGEAGQILALNAAAADLFSLSSGDGLSALSITRDEFEQFERRLSTESGPTLIRAHLPETRPRIPIIMAGTYYPKFRAFVLTALHHHWPDSIDLAVKELFDLSRTEREVLAGLSRGRTSEDLARERGRSVGTVRQQVKSILQKMGVSTQVEAATLAAAATATAATTDNAVGTSTGLLPVQAQQAPLRIGAFRLGDRRVGWRRFGVATGRPVLMLHGPSFGAGEYPEDRRLARRFNLDVHAVERPGYGRTDVPSPDDDPLETQCRDIEVYLARTGLGEATLLAHEVGLIPALDLARRRPELVRGILAVSSAPPFGRLEQIEAMPGHQAIFIQAARHAPWLARLMTRLLRVRTRRLGPEGWTDVIFRDVEPDHEVMQRPGLLPGIIGTYSFYLNQMGAGFEVDLQIMLKDWGHLLSNLPVPLVLLHGARNASTPASSLEIFRDLNGAVEISIIENEGLTLAVSRPDLIYRLLADFVAG